MEKVEWIDWGTLCYREAWSRQESLMRQLIDERMAGKSGVHRLIAVEHPHVYTLGKHGQQANMLIDEAQLRTEGAELLRTDRGGDITYHGPGQLVVYPIFRLDQLNIGIKEYVWRLEEVVIRTIAEYGLHGERSSGATGVWLDTDTPAARKVCAIGVRCSQWVTMHGFALNVNTDLHYFAYINPCGFIDRGVTSLEKETGATVDINTVKKQVIHHFEDVFSLCFNPITQ